MWWLIGLAFVLVLLVSAIKMEAFCRGVPFTP